MQHGTPEAKVGGAEHQNAAAGVDVSVLVPVFNEGPTITEVVRAMSSQQLDGAFELIFADGCSTDDTVPQLQRLALEDTRIRVLTNPRRGVASGLNVCLRAARGRFVARMDGHSIYPPSYLQQGIDRLRAGERWSGPEGAPAWVAGPQVPEPRGRVGAAVAAALATPLGQGGSRRWAGLPGDEHDLDTGVFCGVWRRAELLEMGGWDEGWWVNEDSELAARFLAADRRIVSVGTMAARYIPRSSLPALWRQYATYGRYRARTALRHPLSLRRSAVLPPLVVLDVGAAVLGPRRLRRLARAGLAVYGAALAQATLAARSASADDPRAALLVAPVLATMHLAHGAGFIAGCLRWGVPWRALRHAAGGRAPDGAYRGPVDAPSLGVRERQGVA